MLYLIAILFPPLAVLMTGAVGYAFVLTMFLCVAVLGVIVFPIATLVVWGIAILLAWKQISQHHQVKLARSLSRRVDYGPQVGATLRQADALGRVPHQNPVKHWGGGLMMGVGLIMMIGGGVPHQALSWVALQFALGVVILLTGMVLFHDEGETSGSK